MNALTAWTPDNPLDDLAYPATLPLELALRTSSVAKICEAYDLTREDWEALKANPVFVADLERAVELVKKEGQSFKLKAQLQSDELLKTSWQMIHNNDVPASVRADLLKFTVRCAGLEPDKNPANGLGGNNATLNIQINLG